MRTCFAVLAAGVLAVGVGAEQRSPIRSGVEELTRVDVVVDWPFTVTARKARFEERCRALSAGDVRVREAGGDVRVTGVDLGDRKTVHVLLIDTSRSMAAERGQGRKRLRQTKTAAIDYIDALVADRDAHPGAEIAALTFDDDLLMRSPRTSVGDDEGIARLKRTIESVDGGFDTAFLDAVYELVTNLSDDPERFVLILLSDGADNASLATRARVERAIAEMNTLTVFSIGLALGDGPHRDLLKRVSRVSGGRYYQVHAFSRSDFFEAALASPFDDIRQRLRNQHRVAYVTSSVGEAGGEGRFVDVKLDVEAPGCRITGYKPQRFIAPRTIDAPDGDREAPRVRQGRLSLVVRDVTRDHGPLALGSRTEMTVPLGHEAVDREVEVIVPPLDAALSSPPAGMPEIVEDWLRDGTIAWRPSDGQGADPGVLGGHLMNGKPFLYQRHALARALFEGSPGYRRWTRAVLEPRMRALLRATLPSETPSETFEALLRARLETPTGADLARHLAAWHGDVGTRELAFELELRWIREWLRTGPAYDLASRRLQWERLAFLLRPPERVRIVVPLVLAFDPEREAFGYRRLVLPRLRSMPSLNFPDAPFALEVLTRIVGGDGTPRADALRRDWVVSGIRHEPFRGDVDDRDLPPGAVRGDSPRHRVVVDLQSSPSGATAIVDLIVESGEDRLEPLCHLMERVRAGPEAWAADTVPACRAAGE